MITAPRLVSGYKLDGSVVPPRRGEWPRSWSAGTSWGRVTSSRMSPVLGGPVCLAQVAGRLAAPGTQVTIRLPGGALITARVSEHLAQVDPKGTDACLRTQ